MKTKLYVLFGTFNERMNPAIAIEAIEKLGKRIQISIFRIILFRVLGDYFKAKEQ